MLKKVFVIFAFLMLSACASSPYSYYVKPTPIKQGESKYYLKTVNVKLNLGHGAIPGDKKFADQEKMTEEFNADLEKYLQKDGLAATEMADNALTVTVDIDYTRTFNYGGKALNKPHVSHFVTVYKGDKKLASFRQTNYTTKYGVYPTLSSGLGELSKRC